MSAVEVSDDLYGNDPEMVAMFTCNAIELLDQIESDLLRIERNPQCATKELINKVFRSAHTIKGESGFVRLQNIGRLAHSIENVLDRMRDGDLGPTQPIVSTLLDSFDRMRQLIENVETSESENLDSVISVLAAILNGGATGTVSAAPEADVVSTAPENHSEAKQTPPVSEAAHAAIESSDGETRSETAAARTRVLVIDDEPVTARLIGSTLKNAGIAADIVECGHDALKAMRRGLYNVVICDLNLPDLGGVELMPKLKAISPMVQVLVLTGEANLITVMESLEAGAFDFLPKTQDYKQLIAPVEQALARVNRWAPLMRSRR